MRFLVTGGAGFVGSHLVAAALDRGDQCVVLDDLSTGHRGAVLPGARLITLDLNDTAGVDEVVASEPWDAVFHFASLSLVGDSMRRPYLYLQHNLTTGLNLIDACVRHGVSRFVLSSTAALFGHPRRVPIDEAEPIDPGSPYGESKWMLERALAWADRVHGLHSACLRYFNAAGADPSGRLGEDHAPETHLIPLVIDTALGRRPALAIYGADYPTPDGTCVRDYVHVTDLAAAHLAVVDRLDVESVTYNLGNGTGHSVRDVIRAVERVTGREVSTRLEPRRPGDPAQLVAASGRMLRETGWRPMYSDLDTIIRSALHWRQRHPTGYAARMDERVEASP